LSHISFPQAHVIVLLPRSLSLRLLQRQPNDRGPRRYAIPRMHYNADGFRRVKHKLEPFQASGGLPPAFPSAPAGLAPVDGEARAAH
jgi:hypothetical protein